MWVASRALNISPFSEQFASLSEPQIMWAISNYYKDQEEDLEKYKLVCRFLNPEAASKLWDDNEPDDTSGVSDEAVFWDEIKKHTKQPLTAGDLKQRVMNPEKYDQDSLDKIEVVE